MNLGFNTTAVVEILEGFLGDKLLLELFFFRLLRFLYLVIEEFVLKLIEFF